jgi:hypothetical protein
VEKTKKAFTIIICTGMNGMQKDLQDQILRDRNHPSVIIWSIGNEIPEQWAGQRWKRHLPELSLQENLLLSFTPWTLRDLLLLQWIILIRKMLFTDLMH